ncbi:BZ3500_MvSof-1268-A1-R1_Chr1-3g02383 [Microbotryum saponariae]|uniref:BZ3500_MvSof-1268-A1-R1_Chr1-3g02383 protein n=1 Tax=Microbotryum saponariae TaxID=289078 RepID=A0A2X0M9Z9_9BASI|nr:BZ3500_MvSof-1268-A1-R1_Chr1-3g02383 [Microbotryum saponariae]SCZ96170.1 BZ3501_MvSof-1269-A2-R1_Chr1-3g01986 [Microbotryum saponariae]
MNSLATSEPTWRDRQSELQPTYNSRSRSRDASAADDPRGRTTPPNPRSAGSPEPPSHDVSSSSVNLTRTSAVSLAAAHQVSAALEDGKSSPQRQPSKLDQSSFGSSSFITNTDVQPLDSSIEAEHPSPIDLGAGPLFLAIDSSQKQMRAVVIDQSCRLVWTEEVNCDSEAPEYLTNRGCYRFDDMVCEPTEMCLKVLDLLLEKIARECPDPDLLLKVRRVSGAGQHFTQHFLSSEFPDLLAELSERSESRMSTVLSVKRGAFSLPIVATGNDRTTQEECRVIELALSDQPELACQPPAHKGRARWVEEQARKRGQAAAAQRTGSKCWTGWSAAQLMKVANDDRKHLGSDNQDPRDIMFQAPQERSIETQYEGRRSVWDRTSRVMLKSSLLATLFLGRMAPTDIADACATNLFNITTRDWDNRVLEIVMRQHIGADGEAGGAGAEQLRRLLGPIVDGGTTEVSQLLQSLGPINQYFVKRFNFSPDCKIIPFSGDNPSTFLSCPLNGPREIIVCLGVGDADTVLVACSTYTPGSDHQTMLHPMPKPEAVIDSGSSSTYLAEIVGRNSALGRSLARDLYCNGDWNTFARLVALSPHGGSIGLDDKKFMFWFSEGDVGSSSDRLVRCANGVRVAEFEDRKLNPRLLLESQFLSLRSRYSKLLAQSRERQRDVPPYDPLGFPPHDEDLLPSRIIAVGGACVNPAMLSLLSTMFGCPVYMIKSLCEIPNCSRSTTTSSALGAAHKAAYAYAKSNDGDHEPETRTFAQWLTETLEDQRRTDHHPDGTTRGESDVSPSPRSCSGAAAERSSTNLADTDTKTDDGRIFGFGALENLQDHQNTRENGSWYLEQADGSNRPRKGDDPPGLRLVAEPDLDEHRYYSCMLREFIRVHNAAVSSYI